MELISVNVIRTTDCLSRPRSNIHTPLCPHIAGRWEPMAKRVRVRRKCPTPYSLFFFSIRFWYCSRYSSAASESYPTHQPSTHTRITGWGMPYRVVTIHQLWRDLGERDVDAVRMELVQQVPQVRWPSWLSSGHWAWHAATRRRRIWRRRRRRRGDT